MNCTRLPVKPLGRPGGTYTRAVPTPLGVGFRGPDGRLGYLLRQAQHALWIALEAAMAPLGITASQFGVLRLVEIQPGAPAQTSRTTACTALSPPTRC